MDLDLYIQKVVFYFPYVPERVAAFFSEDSPLRVEFSDGEYHYGLKTLEKVIGGGMITPLEYRELASSRNGINILGEMVKILGQRPKAELWTDEGVSSNEFIPHYKPVVDFLVSENYDFCLVGFNEEQSAGLIGYHVARDLKISPDFEYDLRWLLG